MVNIMYMHDTNDNLSLNVSQHTFSHVRPTKSRESFLSAWRNFASLAIQNAPSEDSDQTAQMRSLIWIFAGRTCPKERFLTSRHNLHTIIDMNTLEFDNHRYLNVARNLPGSCPGGNICLQGSLMPVWKYYSFHLCFGQRP